MTRGPTGRVRATFGDTELRALDAALLAAYRAHDALCTEHPVARGRISRPGIPASFSESLVAVLLPLVFGEGTTAVHGGRVCDLIAYTAEGTRNVEVKASGVSSFQEIKDRDLAADALVWVDFARRYVDGAGPITVHVLPEPARYKRPRLKLTLPLFLSGARALDGFRSMAYATLDDVLSKRAGQLSLLSHPQLSLEADPDQQPDVAVDRPHPSIQRGA